MSIEDLSLEEFRKSISSERVLILKVITFALVIGPVLFAGVAGFVAKNASKSPPEILMTVNFIFAFLALVISYVVPGLLLRNAAKGKNLNSVKVLNQIQVVHIIRFAIVEAAGLFGCVCVLLGIGFINYLSLLPLFITLAGNIPTEKYICRQFIVYFKQDSRLLIELEN